MKKNAILRHLLLPIIIIIVVLTALIIGILGVVSHRTYEDRIITENRAKTALIADNVAAFLSEAYALTEELADSEAIRSMQTQLQNPVLEACAGRNPYFELLYVQDADGMQTGRSSGDLADRSDRWWFKQVASDQKPFISGSYLSVATGDPCASVFIPMMQDGACAGVCASDIRLDTLAELVSSYSEADGDKIVFIIDGEGVVLAHPDRLVARGQTNYAETAPSDSFKKMIGDVMSGSTGSMNVRADGDTWYAFYAPVRLDGDSDPWSVVTLERRSVLLRPLHLSILIAVLIAAAALAIAILLICMSVRRITVPLSDLAGIIDRAAEGDFSLRADERGENAEIARLAGNFNHMTGKVALVLGETIRLVEDVRGSSNEISDVIVESEQSSQEIRSISDCAESQAADCMRVTDLVEQLVSCTGRLGEVTELLADQADAIRNMDTDSAENVCRAEAGRRESVELVDAVCEKAGELSASSEKSGDIVDEIGRLSARTSLLALNASIEAARAGEAGKGFAVVAQDVSKLSAGSAAATGNIRELIADLQARIGELNDLIDQMRQSFSGQTETAGGMKEFLDRFGEISGRSEGAADEARQLIGDAQEIGREAADAAREIRELSEETGRCAQETAKSVAHQAEIIRSLAQKVENMNAASDILELEMQRFTIE